MPSRRHPQWIPAMVSCAILREEKKRAIDRWPAFKKGGVPAFVYVGLKTFPPTNPAPTECPRQRSLPRPRSER